MKLELKNLTIKTNEKIVARDISLTISSGELHVLFGPNGSGKSSLVNGVFGHPQYKIVHGALFLDGRDITHLSPEKKAKEGLFLSLQHLPDIDGVSYIKFLSRAYRELKKVDTPLPEFVTLLKEKAKQFGISADIFKRNVNQGLSGGEKKQLEAFQAMLFEPSFAFFDEIDSGVDVDSLKKILATVQDLKNGGTGFLFITHYPSILRHIAPEKVYIMKEGEIQRSGGKEIIDEVAKNGFQ